MTGPPPSGGVRLGCRLHLAGPAPAARARAPLSHSVFNALCSTAATALGRARAPARQSCRAWLKEDKDQYSTAPARWAPSPWEGAHGRPRPCTPPTQCRPLGTGARAAPACPRAARPQRAQRRSAFAPICTRCPRASASSFSRTDCRSCRAPHVSAGSSDAAHAPPVWTGARAPGAPARGEGQGHRAGWRRGDLRLEVREVAALVALGEAVRAWRAARRRQARAGRARLRAKGGRVARAQRAAAGRAGWALHRRTCARTPGSPLRWGFAFPCRARMDWVSGALGWRPRVGAERPQGCRVCPSQRALHSRSRTASPRMARGASVLSGAKVRHRTLPSLGLDRRLRARRA